MSETALDPVPGSAQGSSAEAPAAAAAEVPAGSARTRRLRGRVLVVGAIALILLLVGGWTGTTYWQLVRSAQHYDRDDFQAAEESGRSFLRMSPFEDHKGHFAIGTARAAAGDLDAAESELTTALQTTPADDECAVRINLALVQEQQGNAFRDADDTDAANERYDAATATLQDAPEECRPSGSSTDERMTGQEERVGGSQDQMNNPQEPGDDSGEGEPSDESGDGGSSEDSSGEDSSGDSGGENDPQQGGSGGDPQSGEGGEETDERMKELEERRKQSEDRHSQTNGGGSGDGVRQPGTKPW